MNPTNRPTAPPTGRTEAANYNAAPAIATDLEASICFMPLASVLALAATCTDLGAMRFGLVGRPHLTA
jgi:hypothetical protein